MKCSTCDTTIEPGMMFCPNCGARAESASSEGAKTLALPKNPYETPPPQSYPVQAYTAQSYTVPAYAATTPSTSAAAIISLIFSVLGFVALPLIGPLVGVIAGHIGRNEIRRSEGRLTGSGIATAGLILGYVQFVLYLIACGVLGLIFLVGIGAAASI